MSEEQVAQERPCLHCMMVDLIDDFFAEYPATAGGSDKVDTDEADELIVAIAKTVAELTCRQDGMIRQQLIEQLMREIMNYDAEYRREDAAGGIGVSRTALDLGRGERAKHVPRGRSDVARQARPGGTSVLRLSVFQGSAPRGCDPPKGSTPPPSWTGREVLWPRVRA